MTGVEASELDHDNRHAERDAGTQERGEHIADCGRIHHRNATLSIKA
jgi:hypothetical protein